MRPIFRILLPLNVFAVAACVYDFQPDVEGQMRFVVIEGDILIGETCRFDVRLSAKLESSMDEGGPVTYSLRVEAGDGTVYPLRDSVVDLTAADISQEYRLVVDVTEPFVRTYVSAWAPVQITPPIDSLSWSIDDDGSKLWVNLSTHSDGDGGFYRWSVSETWEYHATYYASHFFAPAGTVYRGRLIGQDAIVEYLEGDNTYYCWKSAELSHILLGSTKDLSEDKLVNYGLYAFTPEDRKVSHVYCADLTQVRLTEEAWRFWKTLRSNSTDVGGLLSPEPSECRGNLVNVADAEEWVLGYVSVATCARERLFISNYETHFSHWRGPSYEIAYPLPDLWWRYYGWQYRVGWFDDEVGQYCWLPGECVDCRFSGGTKDRPSWWINNDK